MTLPTLAVEADLPSGSVGNLQRALEVASSAIRDAAGVAISRATATVHTTNTRGHLLPLPGPIISVSEVKVDGVEVGDYVIEGNALWRGRGWGHTPSPVEVTYTFGYDPVPADIVDMCCSLAVAWLQHQADGGGSLAGVRDVRLDDASESYTAEASGQVSPVFIPAVTRRWLAARFGGGVHVVETL